MKRTFFGYLYKDIVNYLNFRKIVKRESSNPQSVYNEYRLKHNAKFTKIGFVLTLPDECSQIDEDSKNYFVLDKITPVVKYLDEELQFNEYLSIKEPDPFMEIDDLGNMKQTLSYLVEFDFDFRVLSWGLLVKTIVLSTLGYYAYTLFA